MKKTLFPQTQNFWYLKRPDTVTSLQKDIETEVVVIGGGMAGITAAQAFAKKGKKVVLLEAYFCLFFSKIVTVSSLDRPSITQYSRSKSPSWLQTLSIVSWIKLA